MGLRSWMGRLRSWLREGLTPSPTTTETGNDRNLRHTLRTLGVWTGLSFGFSVCYSAAGLFGAPTLAGATDALRTLSYIGLLALGFAAVGALMGFLFGIPRSLQRDAPSPQPATESSGVSGASRGYRQEVNTNLEQISDWLTKILVGVGLTELTQIPSHLAGLAAYFNWGARDQGLALAVVLNSSVVGFLSGYLVTRLFLAPAFSEAAALEDRIREELNVVGTLRRDRKFDKALTRAQGVVEKLGVETPKPLKKEAYEELVFNSLYEPQPGGFEAAIANVLTYLGEEPEHPSAKLLAFLAMAYGQKYGWRREQGASADELAQIRGHALDAIRRALEIDPGVKPLIRMVWDPNDRTKSPGDNDLEDFATDADFQNLLGPA